MHLFPPSNFCNVEILWLTSFVTFSKKWERSKKSGNFRISRGEKKPLKNHFYYRVLMVVSSRVVFFCTFSAWLCLKVPVFDDLQNLLFFSCFGWWSSWGTCFGNPHPWLFFWFFLKSDQVGAVSGSCGGWKFRVFSRKVANSRISMMKIRKFPWKKWTDVQSTGFFQKNGQVGVPRCWNSATFAFLAKKVKKGQVGVVLGSFG